MVLNHFLIYSDSMCRSELAFMRRALGLAERGRGHVEPNPLVGAVVVRDSQTVGEGWHERFGGPHAEINALKEAGDTTHNATLFVTLEPCCHQGKTPPCTATIIKAGIKRVVAAMTDPFAEVSGKGVAELRSAGVTVDIGLGEAEAARLNAPYLKLIQIGRPYVHAKWAMTLDGKIAARPAIHDGSAVNKRAGAFTICAAEWMQSSSASTPCLPIIQC